MKYASRPFSVLPVGLILRVFPGRTSCYQHAFAAYAQLNACQHIGSRVAAWLYGTLGCGAGWCFRRCVCACLCRSRTGAPSFPCVPDCNVRQSNWNNRACHPRPLNRMASFVERASAEVESSVVLSAISRHAKVDMY